MLRSFWFATVLLSVLLSAACNTNTPAPVATATPAVSANPPTQVRCVMAQPDQAILITYSSSPSTLEQSAIAANCVANGRMGPTWAPLPLTTPTDGYRLICQGSITAQMTGTVWARPSDERAVGHAYDACHVLGNPTYPTQ